MQTIRVLYLVVVAFTTVSVVEGSLVVSAVSAMNQSAFLQGAVVTESTFFIALLGYMLSQEFGWNLRKLTAEPLRTWMLLRAIYWLSGALNTVILYGVFWYVILGAKFFPSWILGVGFNLLFALVANFLVMQSLGQEYLSLSGSSLVGAASFARLARGMIEHKKRYGIIQLIRSVKMAGWIFRQMSFVPKDMDAVAATLVVMKQTDSWSVDEVSVVAKVLEKLPRVDSVSDSFKTFLDTLGWPRGFDNPSDQRRYSDYPRLTIVFTAIVAIAGIVALFSEPIRQGVIQVFGTFVVQNTIGFLGAVVLFADVVLIIKNRWWSVPILALKYWPHENSQEAEEAAAKSSKLPPQDPPSS